ncbi:hypothetical protein [Clostridium grantii]|uniref:Uncharacterized protein n=1 Tax=Clostridium grantii DSM 8605 TaxID=1121316 RepID=A0A1M5XMN1_9CLOT|nr:hypothetical protein [Clostridium grantii]SHI00794.1 hypothetical protein SAMN02745207_03768 [Clostridium grantii DSM 8605]
MNNFTQPSKNKLDNITLAYPEELVYYINMVKEMRSARAMVMSSRQKDGPPKTPPPDITPQLSDQPDVDLKAVDPGAIKPCVYRFSYIWPKRGKPFWAYLVYVGKKSVSGWKYYKNRWVYFGMDLKDIKSFICY